MRHIISGVWCAGVVPVVYGYPTCMFVAVADDQTTNDNITSNLFYSDFSMHRPASMFRTSVRHYQSKYVQLPFFPKEVQAEADVTHLVSRLRVKINAEHRKLSQPDGPEGRLKMLRQTVTALFKYERIEATYNRTFEAQGYAERIISEAIKHGDCHIATMEMADYWLLEKQLIHKLFKVLVPRFDLFKCSYTRLFTAPRPYFGDGFYKPRKDVHIDPEFAIKVHRPRAVLELRGNPFPPLLIPQVSNPRYLQNVLLRAAKEETRKLKVEASLKEAGIIGEKKSEYIQHIIDKHNLAYKKRNILEEQDQLSESIMRESSAEASADNIELKSETPGPDVSDNFVKESVEVEESGSKPEKPVEPSKSS